MHQIEGQKFIHKHAAGETEFTVLRPHRNVGYYECVASRCVSGTHSDIGHLWIVSAHNIRRQQNGLPHDYMR